MKKYILNVPLKDINGEIIRNPETHEEISIRKTVVDLLLSPNANEKVDGTKKLKRFELCLKLNKAEGEVELSLDEAKDIQDVIGTYGTPLLVGRIDEILEK